MQNYTPIDHLVLSPPLQGGLERNEAKPSLLPTESAPLHEVVEHKFTDEVDGFVNHKPDVIELSPDLKSIGVESTGSSQFTTTQPISLPLSDDSIISGLKSPYSSSLRWLSEFCLYILKRAHTQLKVVHGKIFRIADAKEKT